MSILGIFVSWILYSVCLYMHLKLDWIWWINRSLDWVGWWWRHWPLWRHTNTSVWDQSISDPGPCLARCMRHAAATNVALTLLTLLLLTLLLTLLWVGVGVLFLRRCPPSTLWMDPLNFVSASTRDVWIIPSFRIWINVLHVEHI